MIPGKLTNHVYLSELIRTDKRYAEACAVLVSLLEKHNIRYDFLSATKDIWCRDYMPIQTGIEKFVQFRYEPSYLKEYPDLRSDPYVVCKPNSIKTITSRINLDGGNVVNWSDRAIITERVYSENSEYTDRDKLIADIERLLEVEVIVIPEIRSDMTGHADGLVRFVDRNTILGNDRNKEYKSWTNKIDKVLKDHKIEYIDFPFFEHKEKKYPDHAMGCYVNYLEVGDLIMLPVFEVTNNRDQEAIDLIRQIFPDRKFETINYNAVGLHGGLLNCTTWTIKEA